MEKEMKTNSKMGGHILRSAVYTVFLSVVFIALTSAFNSPDTSEKTSSQPRAFSFVERVAYHRVIEDVYWRHRIWPKENPDPKPSLDAVMSQAQLQNKVAGYLHDSLVLEDYWQRPITAEQLQAEMYRKNGNNVGGGGCAWPPTPFDHFGVAEITFHSCSEATRLPDHDNRTTRWLS